MIPALTGMVHLAALPGAPGFRGELKDVEAAAIRDAVTLADAGFDAVIIENFGDAPFYADDVPKATISAMTRIADSVSAEIDLRVGINVLRNDALGALAIAAATGAAMIRVNVLTGSMFTDQGLIIGRAAEVLRSRDQIAPGAAILADVFVKHAHPPPGLSIVAAAEDLATRGGADAVIVSGRATGDAVATRDLESVREAIGTTPLLVGSGATAPNVAALLRHADGVIVGTSLKRRGSMGAPVDPDLAAEFVDEARRGLGTSTY